MKRTYKIIESDAIEDMEAQVDELLTNHSTVKFLGGISHNFGTYRQAVLILEPLPLEKEGD